MIILEKVTKSSMLKNLSMHAKAAIRVALHNDNETIKKLTKYNGPSWSRSTLNPDTAALTTYPSYHLFSVVMEITNHFVH